MSDKHKSEIVKVSEVREEYDYIQDQTCDECGRQRTYKVKMQSLVNLSGFPCDELDCVCCECGAKKTFVFDVTVVFEGYSKMFGNKNP